jgi:mannose-6-phosphate isomerase-like protein (cupin superfamily)
MFVAKPWGFYLDLMDGKSTFDFKWKVKEIIVNPGRKLSLQRHAKRDEFWVITMGNGVLVDQDGKEVLLEPGIPVYVPAGKVHRIENRAYWPLKLVEVQVGMECDEEDIERLADDYGRANG